MPEVQSLPELLKRFSEEQVRLYFFPPHKRPIGELATKLMLSFVPIGCLLVAFGWLRAQLVEAPSTQQESIVIQLLEIVVIVVVFFPIIWWARKCVIPLAQRLWHECFEYIKEQVHLEKDPPPSEEEYEQWIEDIGKKVYEMAPEKLHLSWSKEYSERVDEKAYGAEFHESAPKKWKFEIDLQTRGYPLPSLEDSPRMDKSKQTYRKTSYFEEWHYSINVFAKLFITEDYIAIYTNTVNVREPERIKEKAERGYHQHLSYVSLETETTLIGEEAVKQHYLSLKLDSDYTIRLHAATAELFYAGNWEGEKGIDATHGGLLDALRDHKMSRIRSFVEAEKLLK